MIPILYPATEKDFTNNGIGALSDVISIHVPEEENGAYECEMEYPVNGIHFEDLLIGNIVLAKTAPGKRTQPFQIYQVSIPINGVVTYSMEHISYRTSFIPVKPFKETTCGGALSGLVTNSMEPNEFTVWTDKDVSSDFTVTKPQSFRSLLGGQEGSILDIYGKGTYEFDRFDIKLWLNRGVDKRKSIFIEYGKNLTDIKQEVSIQNTVTGIVPYWSKEDVVVTLTTNPIVYSSYASLYPYKRTVPHDFSEYFDEAPTEDQLRSAATTYINDSSLGIPSVNFTLSFVDLADTEEFRNLSAEEINLCDIITVNFTKLGISGEAKITKVDYDSLNEKYLSIECGNTSVSLSQEIANSNYTQSITPTKSIVEQMIAFQATLMNGGYGGYKIERYVNGHPSETIYGDTNDPLTMKNCLRINSQGIGFSQNGIDGPWTTLWTIDGSFSANAITAGTMKGVILQGCTIEAGSLTNDAKSEITSSLDTKIENMSQFFYADSTGSHVKTAEGSESITKSDGLHVMHNNVEIARFTANDTHVDNLSVATFAKIGSHRMETIQDTESDGTTVNGTAFFWIDDVQ